MLQLFILLLLMWMSTIHYALCSQFKLPYQTTLLRPQSCYKQKACVLACLVVYTFMRLSAYLEHLLFLSFSFSLVTASLPSSISRIRFPYTRPLNTITTPDEEKFTSIHFKTFEDKVNRCEILTSPALLFHCSWSIAQCIKNETTTFRLLALLLSSDESSYCVGSDKMG
jgi:hypothetical protein